MCEIKQKVTTLISKKRWKQCKPRRVIRKGIYRHFIYKRAMRHFSIKEGKIRFSEVMFAEMSVIIFYSEEWTHFHWIFSNCSFNRYKIYTYAANMFFFKLCSCPVNQETVYFGNIYICNSYILFQAKCLIHEADWRNEFSVIDSVIKTLNYVSVSLLFCINAYSLSSDSELW